jgi:hypothetical protein
MVAGRIVALPLCHVVHQLTARAGCPVCFVPGLLTLLIPNHVWPIIVSLFYNYIFPVYLLDKAS